MSSSVGQGLPRVEISGLDSAGAAVEVQRLTLHSQKPSRPQIQKVSFYLPAHILVAVASLNSASSSALLAMLAGIKIPEDGQIIINGVSLFEKRNLLLSNLGYVTRQTALHPVQSIEEALHTAAALRLPRGASGAARNARVEEILKQASLSADKTHTIATLPADVRFRAQIAAECIARPLILLVDEPDSSSDLGSEQALISLLRNLTAQGTTVIFATTSTRSMLQADLLLILDQDGGLVWFGPPRDVPQFVESLRSRAPQIPPHPGLDDFLTILENPGSIPAADWVSWYQTSPSYAKYIDEPTHHKNRDLMLEDHPLSRLRGKSDAVQLPIQAPRSSGIQQYFTFIARNLQTLLRDPYALIFATLAPLIVGIGILLTASPRLFDPVLGDAAQIDLTLSLLVFLTVLIASFSHIPDVTRESVVFRRERQLSAGILPYVLAKLSLVIPIAIYQGLVLTVAYFAAVGFAGSLSAIPGFLITLVLTAIVGGIMGLVASALAQTVQAGTVLALALVLPQVFFGGSIIPTRDLSPVGQVISVIMPARYAFEALIPASGYGQDVAQDVCWAMPAAQRQAMSDLQKQSCTCMGNNIFSKCSFPGIRQAVTSLLDQPEPIEPTPDPAMDQIPVQPVLRPGETLDQYSAEINRYTLQLESYQGTVSSYLTSLRQFLADATTWQKLQSYAIGNAENRIADEINDYGPIYNVDPGSRWISLIGICVVLIIVFTSILFRKGKG
jgi:ABC-type multidrug transport system ATPase subunit/energy-converting hydrogenase Eha subunit F